MAYLTDPLFLTVIIILLVALLVKFKLDLLEISIILLPISVMANAGGGALNLSASDPFLFLLILQLLLSKKYQTARLQMFGSGSPLVRALWLGGVMLLIMSLPVLALQGSSVRAYVVDAAKIATVLLYMTSFAIVALQKFSAGEHRFLKIWSYTAAAVAISGIAGSLLFERGIETGLSFSYRATGTINDPNSFATYMLLGIGVTLLAVHKGGNRFPFVRIALLVAGLYFSYSRAGYIIFAAMLFGVLFLMRGSKLLKKFVGVFVALPVLYLALNPEVLEEVVFGKRDLSIEGDSRFDLWEGALHLGSEQPFFGIGLGQFPLYANREFGAAFVTHNTYLSFFAEGGLVGLTLFVLLVGSGLFAALRVTDKTSRAALIFAITSVLAMSATLNLQNFRHFWAFIGLTFALSIHSHLQRSSTNYELLNTENEMDDSHNSAVTKEGQKLK